MKRRVYIPVDLREYGPPPTVLAASMTFAALSAIFGGIAFGLSYVDLPAEEALQFSVAMACSIPVAYTLGYEVSPLGLFCAGAVALWVWAFAFGIGMIFALINLYAGLGLAGVCAYVCAFHFRKDYPGQLNWLAALPFFIGPILFAICKPHQPRATIH